MKLLVTMAVPSRDLAGMAEGHEGTSFVGARIEIIDWETKQCAKTIDYTPPSENLGEGCSVRFTGGCPFQGQWLQTSGTELVIYDLKDWSVKKVISHPSFHDLHGAAVLGEEIVLVNTGLEMFQILDAEGNIVREVNLASLATWERFDRSVDYRSVASTKPHEVHVNHAFRIDGEWWATRCLKSDAININNPEDRFDIKVGNPHDGIIRGDFIYFTTTNAHLVIANVATRRVEDLIDLNKLNEGGRKIGWCRGIEVDGDHAYVGFSRLRRSKWAGAFHAAKDMYWGRKRKSHIERIDLKKKELIDSYDYETDGSSAIFSLMKYERVLGELPA